MPFEPDPPGGRLQLSLQTAAHSFGPPMLFAMLPPAPNLQVTTGGLVAIGKCRTKKAPA